MHFTDREDDDPKLYTRLRAVDSEYENLDLYEIRVERLWRDYLAERNRFAIGEEAAGIIVAITGDKWRALTFFVNAADLKGGIKLDDKDAMLANVLLDLSQTASISASMVAAENVLKSLDRIGEDRKPRVQQAGFVVLKSPDIPSMLIETAFISNREDERKLSLPAHRTKLANAVFDGIEQYFQGNAPDGTRLAAARRATGTDPTIELR